MIVFFVITILLQLMFCHMDMKPLMDFILN